MQSRHAVAVLVGIAVCHSAALVVAGDSAPSTTKQQYQVDCAIVERAADDGERIVYSARVRIAAGEPTTLQDITQIPFLIGSTRIEGKAQPVIHIASHGLVLHFAVVPAESDGAILDATIEHSRLADVRETKGTQSVRVTRQATQVLETVTLGRPLEITLDDGASESRVARIVVSRVTSD